MQNRRLLFFIILVTLFSVFSLVWYFFFTTPAPAPSLNQAEPTFIQRLIPRANFIFGNQEPDPQNISTEVIPADKQALIEVWKNPSTGNGFFSREILIQQDVEQKTNGTTTIVRKTVRATTTILMFVDRITGYVYGHSIETGETYQISNTTLPGVHNAYIFDGGNQVVMQYTDQNKTIISVLATIPNVQSGRDAQPLENTRFLPNNISSIALSTDAKKISYVVPNTTGSSIYTLSTGNPSFVASSPFSEWVVSYGGNQLYATTKASAYVEGFTVQLPSFSKIIGGTTGLIASPSSDGSFIGSMWSQTGLQTFFLNTKDTTPKSLSIRTLSSKCVSRNPSFFFCAVPQSLPKAAEGLPDDWYQGRVLFADSLMLVNAKTGESFSFYTFDGAVGDMDMTNINLSVDSSLFSYIRKQNGSLWLLHANRILSE